MCCRHARTASRRACPARPRTLRRGRRCRRRTPTWRSRTGTCRGRDRRRCSRRVAAGLAGGDRLQHRRDGHGAEAAPRGGRSARRAACSRTVLDGLFDGAAFSAAAGVGEGDGAQHAGAQGSGLLHGERTSDPAAVGTGRVVCVRRRERAKPPKVRSIIPNRCSYIRFEPAANVARERAASRIRRHARPAARRHAQGARRRRHGRRSRRGHRPGPGARRAGGQGRRRGRATSRGRCPTARTVEIVTEPLRRSRSTSSATTPPTCSPPRSGALSGREDLDRARRSRTASTTTSSSPTACTISDADFAAIEAKMAEHVAADEAFEREDVDVEQALERFRGEHQDYKVELIEDLVQRPGRRHGQPVPQRPVHRPLPRPARAVGTKPHQGLQAALDRRRLLARRLRPHDAHAHLRDGVPLQEGPRGPPRAPRAGARPRPPPARPAARPVHVLRRQPRRGLLAAEGHAGVQRARAALARDDARRAATTRSRRRCSTTPRCGRPPGHWGKYRENMFTDGRTRTARWASSR